MKIIILCTLFVTTFGHHLGDDRVSIRDLGPVIEEHPQELNIQLNTRNGESKVLNLRRRDSLNLDAPVYTTDSNGKVKRLYVRDLDSKAYQDVENGGAFLVKSERTESGLYRRSIRGNLDDGDHEILLEPVVEENDASRKRAVDGEVEHTMVRRKIDRSYLDDDLESAELSAMAKEFGYDGPVIANRSSEPNNTIDKRAGKPLYTVELLPVIDYVAYKRYSSVDKAKEYYAQMVAAVDLRFSNLKSHFKITVKLAGFYFLDAASKSAVTSDYATDGKLQAGSSLGAFGKWRRDKFSSLPKHDHAMLISGYDLVTKEGSSNLAGLAWVGTICSENHPTSIVQDFGGFGIYVAAHELGHNLGSSHDGSGKNHCNGSDGYIMGNGATKNRYTFSPCSVEQFWATIKKYEDKGNNCLKNTAKSADPQVTKPPGQVWDINEQCSKVFGAGSKYLAGDKINHESICQRIQCTKPNQSKWWIDGAAMRGTTCGNKKWCYQGNCVYDEKAPSAPANCMYGDTTLVLYGKTCDQMVKQNLGGCYHYEKQCCKSCPAHKLTDAPEGCHYGDKAGWCKKVKTDPSYCYYKSYLTTCCKSCADLKDKSKPDCPYGDKAGWCSKIKPNNAMARYCYNEKYEADCCKACPAAKNTSNPSCLYGDRMDCSKTHQDVGYCNSYEKYCCKTCPALKDPAHPDCPYGDKAGWCSKPEFTPGSGMCNANAKVCCKKCAKKSS